jgi:anti-sigma B factor antagonist
LSATSVDFCWVTKTVPAAGPMPTAIPRRASPRARLGLMGKQVTFHLSHVANATVLAVFGEIDMSVKLQCQDAVSDAVAQTGSPLIIDLSGVTYLDSTFLSMLGSASKRVREQGHSLHLVVSGPTVRRIFEINGLGGFHTIHETLELALARLSKDVLPQPGARG